MLYAHLKSHRRNVVNILTEVLCSNLHHVLYFVTFCNIISAVHSDKHRSNSSVILGVIAYCGVVEGGSVIPGVIGH